MSFWSRIPPGTQLFLSLLALTTIVWMLRGFGLLSFLPGMVIWLLILLCFATGILHSLKSMR
ncbi:MAG: hypothetical protein MJA27_28800 [Pseudanabaenales cyanobacterium]|nr:hypothetical protein [Pseudanabaenales cyanobacterium]